MPPLRIQAFFHAPFEGLGSIADWASDMGYEVIETHWYAGQIATQLRQGDFLIVMGGPMGVHDEADLPWLRLEKQTITVALGLRCPILGICLGAQLIAHVLGANVTHNTFKEMGWWPIEKTAAAKATWLWQVLPEKLLTFHWHGDTFALPPNAYPLFASEGCANQAYLAGDRVLGLQFHPEVKAEGIQALLKACPEDLTPGKYVQSAEAVLTLPDLTQNRAMLLAMLQGLAEFAEEAVALSQAE